MERTCPICTGNILQIIGRSRTKDGSFLCKNCTGILGDNVFKIRKFTLAELTLEYQRHQQEKELEETVR